MKIKPRELFLYEAIRYDSDNFEGMQELVREKFGGELQRVDATKALVHGNDGDIPLWVSHGEYIITKDAQLFEVVNVMELRKNYEEVK